MEEYKRGILLKKSICYDAKHIDFKSQHLQFPFTFALKPFGFKWRGFIGEDVESYEFNKDLMFYKLQDTLWRSTIYISRPTKYDHLPLNNSELALDDRDDWTMLETQSGKVEATNDALNADLWLRTDTIQVRAPKQFLEGLYEALKNSESKEATVRKVKGWLKHHYLTYTDDWAFHIVTFLFKESEIDSTPINLMAFFVQNRTLFGKASVYCGYHRQINIPSIPKPIAKEFQEWCYARAPRLRVEGKMYRSSIWPKFYNPACWFHRDQICVTDDAVVYTRKTLFRDEMAYLPIKRIDLFIVGSGWFTRKIQIFGEQNIVPRYSFSKALANELEELLKKHNVTTVEGDSFHSSYWHMTNWFGRAPKLILAEDRLIYYPNRISKEVQNLDKGEKIVASTCKYSQISNIRWYKPMFHPEGVLYITAIVGSIRADQGQKTLHMIIPQLNTFKYRFFLFFSGKMRRILVKDKGRSDERRRQVFEF